MKRVLTFLNSRVNWAVLCLILSMSAVAQGINYESGANQNPFDNIDEMTRELLVITLIQRYFDHDEIYLKRIGELHHQKELLEVENLLRELYQSCRNLEDDV